MNRAIINGTNIIEILNKSINNPKTGALKHQQNLQKKIIYKKKLKTRK